MGAMRGLLPDAMISVDLVAAYAVPAVGGRPFVRCNMISTLDGAIAVNGRSGPLGGPADGRIFQVLRSLADAIVVGAGTARAERYGPVRLSEEMRRQRRERGQAPVPPIAVVTRSAGLDWSSPFFTDAQARPIVVTTSQFDQSKRRGRERVADVLLAGDTRVDPRLAFDLLYQAGYRSLLLEGGPGLNADVVRAGLLDELCLTLSPRLVSGSGPRVLAGPELAVPLSLRPVHLLEEDGFLFYRLAVVPPPGPAPAG